MAMTFANLKQLIAEAEASYAAIESADMPISEKKIKARALAYVCNKLMVYIEFLGKQIIPTTAEKEYLEAHCALKSIFRKLKTFAYGSVIVRGLANTALSAGTILVRKSDNMKYSVSKNYILNGGEQEIEVKCLTAGSLGNAAEGEALDFAKVIAGVESTAKVKTIGAGADDEKDADLLARYLEVVRNVYHGGADSDYVKWALQVEGVNQAWAYSCEMGIGSTTVRIMTPNGFPDTVLCQKVKAHIDSVRPPSYNDFFVVSPIADPLDITFAILIPDTADTRTAITAALDNVLMTGRTPGKATLKTRLEAAVLSVLQGFENYDYAISSPAGNVEHKTGEIATLGVITWPSN